MPLTPALHSRIDANAVNPPAVVPRIELSESVRVTRGGPSYL
jgi:hypothetical protein